MNNTWFIKALKSGYDLGMYSKKYAVKELVEAGTSEHDAKQIVKYW